MENNMDGKMEKTEIRAVIKFYYLKGKSVTKIKSKLDAVLGDKAPATGTIHKWVSDFKKGRVGCEDESRSGRPIDVTTPQVVGEIVKIVTNDRSINVRDLGNLVNASYGRVHNILQQNLKIKKISGEWTALELSAEQKRKRVDISKKCLALHLKNPHEFEQRFLCIGASWIRPKFAIAIEPPNVMEPSAKIPKLNPTSKRSNSILVTVCCDASKLLRIEFQCFDEVKEIPCEYYIKILESIKDKLMEKQAILNSQTLLLMQLGSAGILETSSEELIQQFKNINIELLPHVDDSPDLTMSTCHLFPNLRKWLEGRKFFDDEAFKSAILEYYGSLGPGHYEDGIAKLESHWRKCIELNGDYVCK